MGNRDLIAGGVGAVFENAAAVMGHELLVPAAGFAGTAIANYLLGRLERAKVIARSELERAGATAEDFRDANQLAAAAWRISRAARAQAADENLRILAQAMIGCARRQELWSSDFLHYADILAPLSRDELILIGITMIEDLKFQALPPEERKSVTMSFDHWKTVVASASSVLVGQEAVWAIASQAQRSGLITLQSGGFGGTWFSLSPLGRKVREVVDIDTALKHRPL